MADSVQESFLAAWETRFPDDSPPEIVFSTDSSDGEADKLENALRKCTARIRQLQHDLHKEEFVATFLWDSIHDGHGKRQHSKPTVLELKPKPSLSPVPAEGHRQRASWYGDKKTTGWKKSIKNPRDSVTTSNIDGIEQDWCSTPESPESHTPNWQSPRARVDFEQDNIDVEGQTNSEMEGNSGNCADVLDSTTGIVDVSQPLTPVTNFSESENSFTPASNSESPGVTAASCGAAEIIPSVRQSIAFYNSPPVPVLENTSPTGSVSLKKKIAPVTAPRPKVRSRTQVVASDTWKSNSFTVKSNNEPSVPKLAETVRSVSLDDNSVCKPFELAAFSPITSSINEEVRVNPQPSSPPVMTPVMTPSSFHPVSHHVSVPDKPSPSLRREVAAGSPVMSTFKPPPPSAQPRADTSLDVPLPAMQEERIYDEPIAVVKSEIGDDGSDSSDDEPLYYNILLMKQHKMEMKKASFRYPDPAVRLQATHQSPHRQDAPTQRMVDNGGHVPSPEAPSWKKRSSMKQATSDKTEETSSPAVDELDILVAPCPEAEKLEMRKGVITSILQSEREYVAILDVLQQYMKTFKSVADTQLGQITVDDIDVIFFKIPELFAIHYTFINDLEPRMKHWTEDQQIAETFKLLALEEYPIAVEYLRNYRQAVETLQRCCQNNTKFQNITEEIPCHGIREKLSLEELLHKPVVRFQRNTLVLHDLINRTPTGHPDYDLLHKTLKIAQKFLEDIQGVITTDSPENMRYLAKQGLLVEKVGSKRKLRHLFLFQDIMVCANQQLSAKKVHYDCKWFIPLVDVEMDVCSRIEENSLATESQQQHIRSLEQKVSELQHELKRQRSLKNQYRNIDKVKRKLAEQESALMLAAPRLLFHLRDKKQGKAYSLLMSSDYERASWKDTLIGLQSRASRPAYISAVEIQNLINSQKLPPSHAIRTMIANDGYGLEEEYLFGCLNVTIHKLQALEEHCSTYCCVETDAFSHFCCKARTSIAYNKLEPEWNEDFELDLEGAQTLRFLCYQTGQASDILLGRCALELNKAWLTSGGFQEKTLSLGEKVLLTVSLKYVHRDQTIKRTRSEVKGGTFGVKISNIASREGHKVPLIVTSCLNEVEGRGWDEVGIYRVCGQSAEIQKLKKAFERNSKAARALLCDVDINVVTSLLKLYFRELPEALFTDDLYPSLVEAVNSPEPEKKSRMLSLLKLLPDTNFATIMTLIRHLRRISDHESQNKMSIDNLATVFGPTLLRPATKAVEEPITMDLFSAGARDALMQTSILHFFLSRCEDVT